MAKVIFEGRHAGYSVFVEKWCCEHNLDATIDPDEGRLVTLTVSQNTLRVIRDLLDRNDEPEQLYSFTLPSVIKGNLPQVKPGGGYISEDERLKGGGGRHLLLNAMPSQLKFNKNR